MADKECKDKDGRTPLHYTCSEGQKDVVSTLIKKGANINSLDLNGFSPLSFVCFKNDNINDRVTIIQKLIDNKACVNGTSNMTLAQKNQFLQRGTSFKTPLDCAETKNLYSLINKLLEKGATTKNQQIEARNEASSGFISPNEFERGAPRKSITPRYVIRLFRYILDLCPK